MGGRRGAGVRGLLFGALAVCALLWVAAYNGYPTVFSDTGSYLFTGKFFVALWPFRAPGYSVFTRYTSLGRSGWWIVVAQAVVVVYVLHETCAYLIGGEEQHRHYRSYLLGVVCALAVLTSLPWEVSLLMPDVFAGVVFLAAFLLGFDDGLRPARRIILAVILTIAVGAHASLLPIAGLFVAVLAIARFAGTRFPGAASMVSTSPTPGAPGAKATPFRRAASTARARAWLLGPILAAAVGTAALNYEMGMGFRLSPVGNEFLLARLANDGLAKDFLQANCPQRGFVMCKDIVNLPMPQSWFLFYHPLLHDMEKHGDEINEIVRGTLMAYPVRFAGSSLLETLRQLAAFRTGDEVRESNAPNWNALVMQRVFPREVAAFANSRESRGKLAPLTEFVARMHTAVFWLSLAGCIVFATGSNRARHPGFVRTGRATFFTAKAPLDLLTASLFCRARRASPLAGDFDSKPNFRWRVNEFFYAAMVFLVINAAVCSSLAGVYDRYQSRVAWLVPLCLMMYVCCAIEGKKRATA